AFRASTCGRTTAWVSAWGSPNMPPRTWQILWCRPDPAEANATAARYAPYRVCSRAPTSVGSTTTRGKPVVRARMPSRASDWSIGSVRGPHMESTQWASAFSADGTLVGTGRPSIRLASYTITRGSTRGSTPVVLRPSSVRPQTSVASEPAYVVGTATIGRPGVSAIALASPRVDPQPTH